jgi:hypothetical protein
MNLSILGGFRMKLARQVLMFLLVAVLVLGAVSPAMGATVPQPVQRLADKFVEIQGELRDADLLGNPLNELAAVRDLRNALAANVNKTSQIQDLIDLVEDAWEANGQMPAKPSDYDEKLLDLFHALVTSPFSDGEALLRLSEAEFKEVLVFLAALSGTGYGDQDLGFAQLEKFVNGLEAYLFDNIIQVLADLVSSETLSDALVFTLSDAIDELAEDGDAIAEVLAGLANEAGKSLTVLFLNLKDEVSDAVGSERLEEGLEAFMYGYIRSKAELQANSGTGSLQPKLVIQNMKSEVVDLLNANLEWATDHTGVQTSADKKGFTLSGNSSVTFNVQAKEKLRGGIVFFGSITLNPASSGGGGGGGGGGAPVVTPSEPPAEQPPIVEEVTERLDELAEQVDQLPPEQQAQAVREAAKSAGAAVKEAAKVTVEVTVDNGVAKPELDANQLVERATAAKQIAEQLNQKLDAVGAQPVQVELTIDLGTVDADTAEVSLDAELISQLAEAGVDRIAVHFNGVEIVVSPPDVQNGAVVNIVKKPAEEAERATTNRLASDVYDFEIAHNGNTASSFSQPVEMRIPVNNPDQFDTDLLTLAKIEGNHVTYYGGKYNRDTGNFTALRDGFSTYVVVENKVTFNDLAPVERWAGRSIEVAAAKGIIVGDGKGTFRPSDNVTRAEFVKMLVSTLSLYAQDAKVSFADVQPANWYYTYVSVAVSHGIVADGQLFNPNRTITREEMAAMIGRALVSQLGSKRVGDADAVLAAFGDAEQISGALKRDVAVTVAEGVMVGSAGNLNPKGTATRAEAAVVIKKLLDL